MNIECGNTSSGFLCLAQDEQIPATRFEIHFNLQGKVFHAVSEEIRVYDGRSGGLVAAPDYTSRYGESVIFPSRVEAEGILEDGVLRGTWSGDHGIGGKFELLAPEDPSPRNEEALPSPVSWAEFRDRVASLRERSDKLCFRGHSSARWSLSSSFHRTGRIDLIRYFDGALRDLEQHVNSLVPHQFNTEVVDDRGGLLSLAQHHGYPTPLLDWTYSPYVAAFFALIGKPEGESPPRVFAFDSKEWPEPDDGVINWADPEPLAVLREFPAKNNPRHLPQQSVHMFTNIVDVGRWVRYVERTQRKQFLTLLDIAPAERQTALKDLDYMGISAATLFPGLDGVCQKLRFRHFGI